MNTSKSGQRVRTQNDNVCPKCGKIMVQRFDEKQGPNDITLVTPNGIYDCLHCGNKGVKP